MQLLKAKRKLVANKRNKDVGKLTLSIPSISRPLFVPLGACGTAELLSSLPRVEELRSAPYAFFFTDAGAALPVAARRCASISFFRLDASSLFSSVSLRIRSCGTQSSQLQVYSVSLGSRPDEWRKATHVIHESLADTAWKTHKSHGKPFKHDRMMRKVPAFLLYPRLWSMVEQRGEGGS